MPGPLPTENPRRRNAPTIPTTKLPANGRGLPAPESPGWVELGSAGRAWWSWVWSQPQAAGWSDGDVAFVARRASLEDDVAALRRVEGLDFEGLGRRADEIRTAVSRVAALATGRLALFKEMREMDTRLGLNPKGLADLRWSIAPDEVRAKRESPPTSKRRLAAVDAVAGA